MNKYLIKDSFDKIHSLFEGEWTDITENIADINNISQEEYELYGMSSLAGLPMDILNQEEEFEVLAWTDAEESPQIEITVPPFRPLDKLDNQFNIVMGEYRPE